MFFKIYGESNDEASFEFYGNLEEAIAKRIFSDGVWKIIFGGHQNYNSIRTLKPGKVKYDYNNQNWKVTKPSVISLFN